MHRQTVYFDQVPLETDLLHAQQNTMVALGVLMQTIAATGGVSSVAPFLVDGFTCTPTTPASLNVILTPGSVYQLANLEATPWSTLPQDLAHSIIKQGILLDPFQISINKPGTVGFSQIYLIEVQYADLDTGSVTLPYFNAAAPGTAFNGPGGAGTAQNTIRQGIVAIQAKAGVAAATGSQVAPTADAGWVGLFQVTVANSDSAVSSGSITTLSSAPFLQTNGKLPQIPTGVQSGTWDYAVDTGVANAMVCTLAPIPTAYIAGMNFAVKVAAAVTGATTINVNGLGTKSIVHKDGSALIAGDLPLGAIANLRYDGTNFQLLGSGGVAAGVSSSWTYGSDYFADTSVTANIITGTPSASIGGAYAAGQSFLIKVANTVTGSTTINVSAVGAKTLKLVGGGLIQAGDIVAGDLIRVAYDGTNMILLSPIDQLVIDTSITLTANTGIFTDLNSMTNWLNRRRISETGSVTLSFPAASYSYSTAQVFEHPDGYRVSIVGGAVTSPPVGAAATFASVSAAFSTQFTFSGATGFTIRGPLGNLTGIMAIGGAGSNAAGFAFVNAFVKQATNIAACKFGQDGFNIVYSTVLSNGTYAIQNVGNGVTVYGGKFVFQGQLCCNVNTGNGIEGVNQSLISADTLTIGVPCLNGNTGAGAYADFCDLFLSGGSSSGQIKSNTAGGVVIIYSRFTISNIAIQSNSSWTIQLQGGSGQANSCTLTGSSGSGILAQFGANIIITGSSVDGTISPPINTSGNANSFITS